MTGRNEESVKTAGAEHVLPPCVVAARRLVLVCGGTDFAVDAAIVLDTTGLTGSPCFFVGVVVSTSYDDAEDDGEAPLELSFEATPNFTKIERLSTALYAVKRRPIKQPVLCKNCQSYEESLICNNANHDLEIFRNRQ